MKLINSIAVSVTFAWAACGVGLSQGAEISEDGHVSVAVEKADTDGSLLVGDRGVPYGDAPDWQNSFRRQVGGLQVCDMNGDGWDDVIVGCYKSQSYPPYPEWKNYIYFNTGGELESSPSWTSADEVSTTDIQVGDINLDGYPDVFAANGGFAMSPSVIYFGGAAGPSTSPGWYSAEPQSAWSIGSKLFDFDHDDDLDLVTANQGNHPDDAYRPIYAFMNNAGTLSTVPTWASAEWSIQNCLDFADYDGDGWEDLAVSKWSSFESGVYKNVSGTLASSPVWTTGDDDSDKGCAWADIDLNGAPDFILGHDPTEVFTNTGGTLTLAWAAIASYFGHSELRTCDIDRDNDPDLAEIHFANGHTRIYLNNNGGLDAEPTWVYDAPGSGTALAFGDINGDSWPDLVVGLSGDISLMVFYGEPQTTPGDLNCDGVVDFDDINPFVIALGGEAAYNAAFPDCEWLNGDIDGNGAVDFDDINPFVGLIGS